MSSDEINSKIWRNYYISIGLGVAALGLGALMAGYHQMANGSSEPQIANISPNDPDRVQKLVDAFQNLP